MPSPFPGMDPYLESPDWFPCLHDCLITYSLEWIQTRLPGSYYAQSSQRVWLEYSRRHVEPDVEVIHTRRSRRRGKRSGQEATSSVAVLESPVKRPVIVSVAEIEHGPFQESFIEIRRREGKERRLVTSIEVLSAGQQDPRQSSPREIPEQAVRKLLEDQVHLVEIDLLRAGTHTSAVPLESAEVEAGPYDYHTSVRRFDRPKEFLVYPIALDERLPTIGVPLLPGDPDVPLDLQAVFDRAYDAGPYQREIEYGRDAVVPPLKADRLRWVKAMLKSRPTRPS